MANMLVSAGLLAAWLMLNGISCSTTVGKDINAPPPYLIQAFDTRSIDPRKSYVELIRGIRELLTDDELGPVFGIPRLGDPNSVPSTRRFLLLNLFDSTENRTITLAIDTARLYVVGYRTYNEFYYFPDLAQNVNTLFPDFRHTALPFNSSYSGLAGEAGDRGNIPLGLDPLEQAIVDLEADSRRARSLTVIIQMISEAIRFRYIENFVANDIIGRQVEALPTATMMVLENTWGCLSRRIQNSRDGIISPAVSIVNMYGVPQDISTVTRGLNVNIGILFFVCNRPPNANVSDPIIRLPIEKGTDTDTCKDIAEPTVRIFGRNGLCVDVKGGSYGNGNPIIVWPCKSNVDVNQLWTLKADGTIRSNGKCLTTSGYEPGNYTMIYECTVTVTDAMRWEIWDNGTIVNSRSSLVLTATSGIAESTLTLEKNVYATSQAWVVANETRPTVTPVMNGNGDMCLEALDYDPKIFYYGCQCGESRQLFAVYQDGSIRPNKTRDDCLTADTKNLVVVTAKCDGGAAQRWSFNNDNTVSNLGTGLAMDAQHNVVTLSPGVPRQSQEWHAWFL
ncbi:ricin-like [Apium graveolens]|uniref:ricin-like n=1 Tax=Apium graveolens TaxID=4045 RepID=UPI003D7B4079